MCISDFEPSGHVIRTRSSTKKAENIRPKVIGAPSQQRLRMYIPPVNFGAVEDSRIFRSSYPDPKNYPFLESLGIRTIMFVPHPLTSPPALPPRRLTNATRSTLVPEPLPPTYYSFITTHNIRHFQTHVPANKDGQINMTPATIAEVLAIIMNRAHHPILIHCNRGKHRTGCVIACFRLTQGHSLDVAIREYRDYASPKCRPDDERFIASFDPTTVKAFAQSHGWMATPPPEPVGKVATSTGQSPSPELEALQMQRESIMQAVWTRLPSPSPSEDVVMGDGQRFEDLVADDWSTGEEAMEVTETEEGGFVLEDACFEDAIQASSDEGDEGDEEWGYQYVRQGY